MKNTDYYKYAVYDANDYTVYEPMRLIEGFDTLKEARQAARVYEATTATENAKAEARLYEHHIPTPDVRVYRLDEHGFIIWKNLYHG